MQDKGKKLLMGLPVLVLCLVLIVMAVSNIHLTVDILRSCVSRKKIDFSGVTDRIADALTSDGLTFKNDFVNLNGLLARLTGRDECNGISRMKNGMLTEYSVYLLDLTVHAGKMAEFARFCAREDIPFTYVQTPGKMSLDQSILPNDRVDYSNENTDSLLNQLKEKGVRCLDLRPFVAQDEDMINRFFYRTDHHWNPEGAFTAFPLIMDCLGEMLGGVNQTNAAPDRWTKHTVPEIFLGSRGKRTGVYFGGVDDLIYYTPNFETDYTTIVADRQRYLRGDFEKAVLREDCLTDPDYFEKDNYSVYYGGNYPLMTLLNPDAENQKHILVIKDSFVMPLLSFLQSEFTEVTALDPRYYTDSTVAEYIAMNRPDAVLAIYNTTVLSEQHFFFTLGGNEAVENLSAKRTNADLYHANEGKIWAVDGDYNSYQVPVQLQPGLSYRLHLDNVDFQSGQSETIVACVYSTAQDSSLMEIIWEVDHQRRVGSFDWAFLCPESVEGDTLEIRIYPGIPGQNRGIGAILTNVTLTAEYPASGMKTIYMNAEEYIQAENRQYNSLKLSMYLTPGKTYQIEAEGVTLLSGDTENVTVRLTDVNTDRMVNETQWSLRKGDFKWRVTVPRRYSSREDCYFQIFAGEVGRTENVSLHLTGLRVHEIVNPYGTEVYYQDNLALAAESYSYHDYFLPATLQAGKTYTLFIRNVSANGGNTSGFNAGISPMNTQSDLARCSLILNGGAAPLTWTVTVPANAGDCRMRVFSGWAGSTNGVGLKYENLGIYLWPDPVNGGVVYTAEQIEIKPSSDNHNAYVLPLALLPERTYRVRVEGRRITSGNPEAVTVKTWSDTRNQNVDMKDWVLDSNVSSFDWIFTTPSWITQQRDLSLQFCAGKNGETAGIGVIFTGITVEEVDYSPDI